MQPKPLKCPTIYRTCKRYFWVTDFFTLIFVTKNLAASPLYLNHLLCFIKTPGINQKRKTMTLRRMSIWNFTLITIEKTHSDSINAREVFQIIMFCTKTILNDKYCIIQSIFFLPTWAFSSVATVNYFGLALLSVEECKSAH